MTRPGSSPRSIRPLPHPLTTELQRIAEDVALPRLLTVVSVQVLTHRIPTTIQVLIRPCDGGDVSLDLCAELSRPLEDALEASALLDMPYVLEVSSPGIGEELATDRDFSSFRGFPVQVHMSPTAEGAPVQEGLLLGRDVDHVLINVRGRPVRLPRPDVLRVRLVSPGDSS